MLLKVLLAAVLANAVHADEQSSTEAAERDAPSRIYNGKKVIDRARYSFFSMISDGHSRYCGGSLIADNVVLSAAHCYGVDEKAYVGYFSDHDTEDKYEVFDIKHQIIHKKFDNETFDNDFMITILDGKSTRKPVCLPASSDLNLEVGQKLHILGFGQTEKSGYSENLKEADVEYISNDMCDERYFDWYSMTRNMMCCDSLVKKDACDGDSGGPLLLKGENNERDILVGLISWGLSCAEYPGVYSRISTKVDWIESKLSEYDITLPECNQDPESSSSNVDPVEPAQVSGAGADETIARKRTSSPTYMTTHTYMPTYTPTLFPTQTPTHIPTQIPTFYPTIGPTSLEVFVPTFTPTFSGTSETPTETLTESETPTETPIEAPTEAPIGPAKLQPKCVDEVGFLAKLSPAGAFMTGNRCNWVKQSMARCDKVNVISGRKFKAHCPLSCNTCNNAVLDNREFQNNYCARLAKNNKWNMCQKSQTRANCPVTCSCVRTSFASSRCEDFDEEKCKSISCDNFLQKKNCPEKCGICNNIDRQTCPIRDEVEQFFDRIIKLNIVCKDLRTRSDRYKRDVCGSVIARSKCPIACSSVPY
uniref:Peptidase S1 domain-containing protein n=1 Tax=Corethron hystrix TaxID=216773 RepID=A0A7S1B855_9STRA|mmetsp:Transcript_16833/g.37871  ORF Transcript_16833/g.37871 Transcript_16833/m.37871 type:complete len:591 (+) Transcript_16833:97-1869(+)